MDVIAVTLVQKIHVSQFLTVRYWLFTIAALWFLRRTTNFRKALKTSMLGTQIFRSLLAVSEVGIFIFSLKYLTLAEAHSLLASFPLIAIVMAAIFLNERLQTTDIIAVLVGFAGTLIILRPGMGVFEAEALIPLSAAILFAGYNVLTRRVSQVDSYATTLLYTALVGTVVATVFGLFHWTEASPFEWVLMGIMGIFGVAAQFLLVAALGMAPTTQLQPFNYSLLFFATLLGGVTFGQIPDYPTIIGACCIVGGGLFALMSRRKHFKNQN